MSVLGYGQTLVPELQMLAIRSFADFNGPHALFIPRQNEFLKRWKDHLPISHAVPGQRRCRLVQQRAFGVAGL